MSSGFLTSPTITQVMTLYYVIKS